ncbi:hypothetical protein PIB30_070147 [Stylosanthes scabra]|uniref:Uncharacterized protein n=1 Tax=Stylosanthes scabra TaxID=79078 RepID=A0ABU6YNZ3_9FABA|nr:hypothetical protein [Stylosanthes scabra]
MKKRPKDLTLYVGLHVVRENLTKMVKIGQNPHVIRGELTSYVSNSTIWTESPRYTSSFHYARLNYSIVKGEELCSPGMRHLPESVKSKGRIGEATGDANAYVGEESADDE